MGWPHSKTKYYVSSSTFPLFDSSTRVNNYEAGMLDYTSNSTLEQYEYFKNYYNTSRLRDIRGLLRWADSSGYHSQMGKISSTFYSDASFDNDIITEASKQYVSLSSNQTYQVYSASLNRFSEDFWLKHLATQQGKASLFFEGTGVDYTVDFPDSNTVRATFSNGQVVSGAIPANANTFRYIEISYSIETETEVQKTDKDGNPVVDSSTNQPIMVTEITYTYGYYDYQEGSGNSTLDSLIKNNNISNANDFYPVIPIRTDTHWFSGTDANHISAILKKLHLYNTSQLLTTTAYNKMCDTLTEGINKSGNGSLGDIDYMTIILGVPINTRNSADQRYLFEFFYNLYVNYSLMRGDVPQQQSEGLNTYSGKGVLKDYFNTLYENVTGDTAYTRSRKSSSSSGRFTKFTLTNEKSNLNLTYEWGHAGYFEANGKWKPTAKVGEYGVLAGLQRHDYTYWKPRVDSEGNYVYVYDESTGTNELQYDLEHETAYINLVLFCKQTSENRWKFVMFSGLGLTNLVYHGKTVYTDAYEDVKDSSQTTTLEHNFTADTDGTYDDYTLFSFKYVDNPGDSDSAFIVPLEQSTFYEIGVPAEVDISQGCQYLICNCWEKKKVKWYQSGWLGVAIGALGMAVFCFSPTAWIFFVGLFTITFTVKVLELVNKICVVIFGEKLGNQIYSFVIQIIKTILVVVASICVKIPVIGWIIWAICMAVYTVITIAEYLRQGLSMGEALKRGLVEGAIASAASLIGGQFGGGQLAGATSGGMASGGISGAVSAGLSTSEGALVASVSVGLNTTGQSLNQGESIGKSLGQGVIAGGSTYLGAQAGGYVKGAIGGGTGAVLGSATQGFVSGFTGSFGNSLLEGDNLGEAFRTGLIQGGISAGFSAANAGYQQLSKYMGWGKYGLTPAQLEAQGEFGNTSPSSNSLGVPDDTSLGKNLNYLQSLDPSTANSFSEFGKVGWSVMKDIFSTVAPAIAIQTLENPNTYVKLLSAAYADQMYHKMANLANDYEEFNDKYRAATKVLNMLNDMNNSSVTTEFACLMQACLGKMSSIFPEFISTSAETFLSMGVLTGHDLLKNTLASPSAFADTKLSMDGYTPYSLHYTSQDYDLIFTETSTILT
jgi:hypothetical protein